MNSKSRGQVVFTSLSLTSKTIAHIRGGVHLPSLVVQCGHLTPVSTVGSDHIVLKGTRLRPSPVHISIQHTYFCLSNLTGNQLASQLDICCEIRPGGGLNGFP